MYKTIIALGLIPLIGITAYGGYELATTLLAKPKPLRLLVLQPKAVEVPADIVEANDATETQKLLNWISEGTSAPFSSVSLPNTIVVRESEMELQKAWQEHNSELEIIKDCARILSTIMPRILDLDGSQLREASSSLLEAHDTIKKKFQSEGLNDVARSVSHLEKVARELNGLAKQKEDEAHDKVILNHMRPKIRTAVTPESCQECLNELSKLRGERDAETKQAIISLEFLRDATRLDRKLKSAISDFGEGGDENLEGLVAEFKGLNEQYRGLLLPASEDLKKLDFLTGEARKVEGLSKLHLLGEPKLERLKPWVRETGLVIEEYNDANIQESVSKMIESMFTTRIQKKSSTANPRLQYVEGLGDGSIYEGVFKISTTKITDTDGTTFHKKHYSEPRKVPEITCVEQYNSIRDGLLKNMTTFAVWRQFQSTCDRLDEEMTAYKGDTNGVSFKKESEFARQVLDGWDDLDSLFRLLK